MNGNWAEHLMNPQVLANILSDAGFNTKVLSGYYGHNKNPIKNTLAKVLNGIISISRNQGIKCAPFYTIHGKRS